ncbi:MAG TPA: alpha/beta-type small acid-soluble spore protein [Firmicutes bacterium]|nr:alpha/beta-type small acid-soluble spore protein [Bacillota bacterium]
MPRRNRAVLPQARPGLNRFKYEIANQVGVDFNQYGGYLGHLPSAVNGRIGGQMVRNMIAAAEQALVQQAMSGVKAGFTQALQGALPSVPTNFTNETNVLSPAQQNVPTQTQ